MTPSRIIVPNDILLGEVNNLLCEGRPVVIMTKGNSMFPFIRGEKDSVRLKKKDCYEIGEAVLAQIGKGHYVLHRLVNIEGDAVTLQGDGNLKGQEHCTLADICGAVTEIISEKGKERGPANRAAALWRKLPFFVKRYFLAIYRRII